MNTKRKWLRAGLVQGFGTLIVREFLLKLISLAGQIFLARLLLPSDFGIYAILVFLISIFSLFTDIGLTLAIIQKHETVSDEEISSVFGIKMCLTFFLVFFVWICAPLTKLIYPEFTNLAIWMTRIFSLTLVTTSLRAVPVAMLERQIKYHIISLLDIFGVFIYYLAALLLAFFHFGAWSFIYATLAKEICETGLLYYFEPFVPKVTFSLSKIKKMIKFGAYIQGNTLVAVLYNSLTPVVGGRMSGTSAVGLLDFAYNIASLPIIISQNFSRVAFAGYARIQKEKELFEQTIGKSMSMLAIILYIFPVLLIGLGKEIIPVVFSAKWIPALPALYWYSLTAFLQPIISAFGQGILVTGKSREIFWTSFVTLLAGFLVAAGLVHTFAYTGIAITFFSINLSFTISYIFIFRKAGYHFSFDKLLLPKLVVALFSLAFLISLDSLAPSSLLFFCIKLLLTVTLYVLLLFYFVRQDSLELLGLIREWIISKKL